MKKILAIISSPRKLGNSEIMVKEISRNISEPHELQLLRLSDFSILPCIGCYMCLVKNKGCVLKDDFNMLAEKIIDADALIVAAPTYFLGVNSCLKRFSDRGLALYPHAEKLWGKPAVGVGIAGIPGKEGSTLLGIESFIKLVLADMKQVRLIYGALPGEIFLNNENRDTARQLASALFEPAPEKHKSSCPLCGGKTFRFLGQDKVQCMLCSNMGTMTIQDNIPGFDIQKSEHELFLSLEEVIEHREWLLNMKSRFLKHKDELKKISLDYRKQGEWIKP
ncbi:flavodoxin family protein [Desulfobacterales bacterium HSG17]|nr:flavodoxin family protein [Desulfobacterales bacterium HSG17]